LEKSTKVKFKEFDEIKNNLNVLTYSSVYKFNFIIS